MKGNDSQMGAILPLLGHLAMSGDVGVVTSGRRSITGLGCCQTSFNAQGASTTKNCPTPNVNGFRNLDMRKRGNYQAHVSGLQIES